MKPLSLLLVLIALASPAAAQPASQYAPPDAELWAAMAKAISDVPMSMNAHAQIVQILQNVQREAMLREVRAKAQQTETPKQ